MDVGVSREEEGHNIRFLNAFIHVEGNKVQLAPFNPNILFALGLVPKQKIARLGSFINSHLSHYHTLRTFLLAQVMVMDHLGGGSSVGLYFNVWCLLSEVVKLGWPLKWVQKALRSIPRRHVSTFIIATRFLGRVLKLHDWLDIGHPLDHFCAQYRMCTSQISYAIDNNSQLLDPQGSTVLANTLAMGSGSEKGKGKHKHKWPASGWQGNKGRWHEYQKQQFRDNRKAYDSMQDEGGNEVMNYIQEEFDKEIAKKKEDQAKSVVVGGMKKFFGFEKEPKGEKKKAKGKEKFHFVRKITRSLFRRDTEETDEGKKKKRKRKKSSSSSSDTSGSSEAEKKKKKKKKKVKKKSAKSSSDSSGSSSSSTPDWIENLRKDAKKRVSKKEKEKEKKKLKEKEKEKKKEKEKEKEKDKDADLKKAPGAFVVPASPAGGAESSSSAITLVEAKELFRKSLFLEDKVTMEELAGPEWLNIIITNARQEDLKQMAGLNNISKAGRKEDLAQRILESIDTK